MPHISPVSLPSGERALLCDAETLSRDVTCREKYGLSCGGGANEAGRSSLARGIEESFVRVWIADFQLSSAVSLSEGHPGSLTTISAGPALGPSTARR